MRVEPPLPARQLEAYQQAVERDISARHVRALDADVAEDGQAALGLLLLNPEADPLPRLSFCSIQNGTWWEEVQDDGFGEAATNWASGRWVSYVSGRAPRDAFAVEVRLQDELRTRAIVAHLFVVAFWHPRADSSSARPTAPELVKFH